ncbi:predicted protein [Nematostella vectensis]|uniref:Uncharacterized protein n=1 Tax=Nematostella vectensis TaxID=45351 RepID=A7RWN2_NEMVE|nr:predicted protein [Nematostella vectensis]|eukprot:XP_001636259.1 predicted protein [Nematostella vectensis]
MNLRMLLRFLNDQHLVERLANTSVIRRFAQLTHYSYLRATSWGKIIAGKALLNPDSKKGLERVWLTHKSTTLDLTFKGNKSLEKLSEASKTQEEGRASTTGRLVSFSKRFMENIQREIEGKASGGRGPYH